MIKHLFKFSQNILHFIIFFLITIFLILQITGMHFPRYPKPSWDYQHPNLVGRYWPLTPCQTVCTVMELLLPFFLLELVEQFPLVFTGLLRVGVRFGQLRRNYLKDRSDMNSQGFAQILNFCSNACISVYLLADLNRVFRLKLWSFSFLLTFS